MTLYSTYPYNHHPLSSPLPLPLKTILTYGSEGYLEDFGTSGGRVSFRNVAAYRQSAKTSMTYARCVGSQRIWHQRACGSSQKSSPVHALIVYLQTCSTMTTAATTTTTFSRNISRCLGAFLGHFGGYSRIVLQVKPTI